MGVNTVYHLAYLQIRSKNSAYSTIVFKNPTSSSVYIFDIQHSMWRNTGAVSEDYYSWCVASLPLQEIEHNALANSGNIATSDALTLNFDTIRIYTMTKKSLKIA